ERRPPPRRAEPHRGRPARPAPHPLAPHGLVGAAPRPPERRGARRDRSGDRSARQAPRRGGATMTAAILRLNERTFMSLKRSRNYRLFFSGQIISVTGTWMQRIAQAWLILQLTHNSAVAVGFMAFAQFLPFTIFGLFAGTFVDRIDARRTVIATQTGAMLCSAGIASLALAGVARPWEVYAIAAVNGTIMVLDAPARQALTFRMVGRQ